MENNIKNSNFDIIVLAGQSNAEGNGKGNEELIYGEDSRIYQIRDINPTFYKDEKTNPVLQITLPMEKVIELECERETDNGKAASFADTFVRRYVENGFLLNGRKLLLVRCAVGGSGFSRNEWGKDCILYNRMTDVIDYALNLGGDNKIVAMLWHQGEHDAFEQKQLTISERYDFYYKKLYEQMKDFRLRYGNSIPIIAGEYCLDDAKNNLKEIEAIQNATKDCLKELKISGVASSADLLSNDEKIGDGDRAHFCRESCKILGDRYFDIYKGIKTEEKN